MYVCLCVFYSDGVVDEESPLGGQQEDKGLGYTEENSLDKDFEGSPILLPPGGEIVSLYVAEVLHNTI